MRFSIGNTKIGKDTAILNITSATDCIAWKLGLCQLCGMKTKKGKQVKCYAKKAEIQYPSCLPFRREQNIAFDTESPESISADLRKITESKRRKIQVVYVRFSESGDFRTQDDVNKLSAIAEQLPNATVYGYTARKDLDYSNVADNVVVNGSNHKNGHNTFTAVKEYSPNAIKCPGDCFGCNLCKVRGGRTIECLIH
jgi:hypothetical protein